MPKIRLKNSYQENHKIYKSGSEIFINEKEADRLIKKGHAERIAKLVYEEAATEKIVENIPELDSEIDLPNPVESKKKK